MVPWNNHTPFFVISCPEEAEREAKGLAHFKDRGIPGPIVIPGIHGETFGLSSTRPYGPNRHGYSPVGFPTPKEVGIYLSHYMLWAALKVLKETPCYPLFTHAVILEIDASLDEEFIPKLHESLWDLPPDYDFLHLGYCYSERQQPEKIRGSIFKVSKTLCTHAYVLNTKALPFLLSSQRSCYTAIDVSLSDKSYPHLNVWACTERIVGQDRELPP
jgi:GR25 family glycosyltransferase involved in LPS biosynthesis